MTSPIDRGKLGMFLVAGLVAAIAALVWVAQNQLDRPSHEAWAFFNEPAIGLEAGSPVRFRGVSIGVVSDITLAADKRHLAVRMALYDSRLRAIGLDPDPYTNECDLPFDLRAQLVRSLLTETCFVLVDFAGPDDEPPPNLPFEAPRSTIRAVPSSFRSLEDGLQENLRELPPLITALREFVATADRELQGLQLTRLAEQMRSVLASADEKLQGLDTMAPVVSATRAFDAAHELVGELRGFTQRAQQTLDQLELPALAADLRSTGGSIRAAADRIAGEASVASGDLRDQLQTLRGALLAIERLAVTLERDPGALLRGRGPTTSPLQEGR